MKAETQESGVLGAILATTRQHMDARAAELPEWRRQASKSQPVPSFSAALAGDTVAVIGEVKRRSPSAGAINEGADAVELARAYADAGAKAISVLTEEVRFGGSLEDLLRVSRQVGRPTLRKDFIIDPIQIYEARAMTASAVLLIVRALPGDKLGELAKIAHDSGLATLVEVHSVAELEAALAVKPTAIGVNARDLGTLELDEKLAETLLPRIPREVIAVAESGLKTREDVERVASFGADAVLVGTAVAGAANPGAAMKELVGVPKVRGDRGDRGAEVTEGQR